MKATSRLRFAQAAGYLFALSLPLSVFWPLWTPAFPGILNVYVEPGIYLSDLALTAFLLTGFTVPLREGRSWPIVGIFAGSALWLGGLAILTAPFALYPSLAAHTAVRWVLAGAVALRFLRPRQGDLCPASLTKVFVLGLAVHALIGAAQTLLQRPLGLPGEMALPLSQPGAAVVSLAGRNWLRAYGLTFHPNVLGGYLVVGILLSVPLLVQGRRWIGVWWLLWTGLALTLSRSAALAAVVTTPIAVLLQARSCPSGRRPLAVAVAGLVLLGGLAAMSLSGPMLARLDLARITERLSMDERGAQTQVALGILAARPAQGVGAGNFPAVVQLSGSGQRPLPVHNVPLLLASEVGVLGGSIWIATALAAVATLVTGRRRLGSWSAAGLCAWLALWVVGLFDYYPWALNAGRLLSATVLGVTSRALLDDVARRR